MRFILILNIALFLVGTISQPAKAQVDLDELAFLADVCINADEGKHRIKAHQSLYPKLLEFLKSDSSYQADLKELKWLSILNSEDKSFRVITWQLKESPTSYKYFGFIQRASNPSEIIILNDESDELNDVAYTELDKDSWFGAVYYNMMPFKSKDGDVYLLFGFNGKDGYNNSKLLDVLYFSEGEPIFGQAIFNQTPEKTIRPDRHYRIKLDYAYTSIVNMNWSDDYNMIIHDHLIPLMSQNEESNEPSYVSDGSYVGYKSEDGEWKFVEKIFHQTLDEAPREMPVLDKKNKNIIGKDRKGKRSYK